MINSTFAFPLLLLVFYLPLCACQTAEHASEEGLAIDFGYFKRMRTSEIDVGTVHVLLNNAGNQVVGITAGFINEVPLSDQEAFLWHRISPNPIPPLGVGELVVRLRQPRVTLIPSGKFSQRDDAKLRLVTTQGDELFASTPMFNHPFFFTFIGFNATLDTIYLYIKNVGQKDLTVGKIFLSSKNITRNCRIPERNVKRNEQKLAVIHLDEPLIRGQFVNVKVTTKQRIIAQSRVKAFSDFPLDGLDRKGNLELFMDAARLDWTEDEKKAHEHFHHLLDCPMHSGDDHSVEAMLANARIIVEKIEKTGESSSFIPGYIHVCRADIFNGSANFGQIADFIRINPNIAILPSFRNYLPEDTDDTPVQYLTAFAKEASQPRPLHTTTDIVATSPPELQRLLVYAAVSRGSKGVFYRIWGDSLKDNPKLKQEIKKINGELQVLKRYLKFGEPMPLAACTHPDVDPTTILAGDKAIVLILIDRNPIESEKTADGIRASFSPKLDFEVTVHTPRWMQIKDVYEVGEDFGRPKYRKRGNRIVIKVDRLDFTKQIVLTTRADDYDHDQDQDGISDIEEIVVHDTHPAIPNFHPTSQAATN